MAIKKIKDELNTDMSTELNDVDTVETNQIDEPDKKKRFAFIDFKKLLGRAVPIVAAALILMLIPASVALGESGTDIKSIFGVSNMNASTKSINGKNGVNGKDGVDGINGEDGQDGTNGVDGVNGTDGLNGEDGKNGINGKNGVNGKTGSKGATGKTGSTGNSGTTGATGATGKAGATGTTGKAGADGASVFVRYAEDNTGSNMTNEPTATSLFMGVSTVESNNPDDYVWSQIKEQTITMDTKDGINTVHIKVY